MRSLRVLLVLVLGFGLGALFTGRGASLFADDEENSGGATGTDADANIMRKTAAGSAPELCVLFVSCNRPKLLREAMARIYTHMNRLEPTLAWEAVLVEQRTPLEERAALARRFELDVVVSAARARGVAWPFNVGYFGVCRAPYVAVVEEDWMLQANLQKRLLVPQIFTHATQLLPKEPQALGVLLRSENVNWCEPFNPHRVDTPLGRTEVTLCVARKHKIEAASERVLTWGSYTNGVAVYDRARLAELGRQDEAADLDFSVEVMNAPEVKWSRKAALLKMGMLWVRRHRYGKQPDRLAVTSTEILKFYAGVFDHAGYHESTLLHKNRKSPCQGSVYDAKP